MDVLQKLIYLEQDARKFGFDWPDHFMILAQVIDECREVREEIEQGSDKARLQEEIGDLLHSVISLCVFSGFDVEETIDKINTKFSRRMRLLKELTERQNLENLNGQSIDFMLNLWRKVKKIEHLAELPQKYSIVSLATTHIPSIAEAFHQIGWNKPPSFFARYLKEQETDERCIWVAFINRHLEHNEAIQKNETGSPHLAPDEGIMHDPNHVFAGYITLKWQSHYPSFKAQNIPEIMDLNVLPQFRKMGIGSLLLDTAEKEASTKSDIVGIGVGLYAGEDGGYGAAQRLYIQHGYIPDGKSVTYNYEPTIPGESYSLDDDLMLWFTKKIKNG
jgi:NTP pyrophosphatase (non-canonical NTP hydrolase)/GNAT superfamily N-acetyltransferase